MSSQGDADGSTLSNLCPLVEKRPQADEDLSTLPNLSIIKTELRNRKKKTICRWVGNNNNQNLIMTIAIRQSILEHMQDNVARKYTTFGNGFTRCQFELWLNGPNTMNIRFVLVLRLPPRLKQLIG
jgi:hypothetical protein